MKKLTTPWGMADQVSDIGDGILRVDTPSHGGYFVPLELYRRMPPALQGNVYGGGTWFEEDCEWALVAFAFPQHFTPEQMGYAVLTIGAYSKPASQYHSAWLWLFSADGVRARLKAADSIPTPAISVVPAGVDCPACGGIAAHTPANCSVAFRQSI